VPSCGAPPCSQTLADNTAQPDYAAWAPDGSLYVTDYTQGLVWRVPPGGGRAQVWLTDPRLDGGMFGTSGIVLLADRRTLLISQASSQGPLTGNPTTGRLYRVAIGADGRPGALEQLWESGPAEAPDGFAVARSGNVYLALVGPGANQLVEISPSGAELARFPASRDGSNGSSVPVDGTLIAGTARGRTASSLGFGALLARPASGELVEPATGVVVEETAEEAKDRALHHQGRQELDRVDLAVLGLGRLLLVEDAPERVEGLLGQRPR
jgi:hypothetical protein